VTRDELIESYLPYVKERARYWGYRYPFLRDDILSVAMLVLVEICDKKTDFNKAYLSLRIESRINDLLAESNLIRIPRSERQKRKAENKGLDDLPKAVLLGDDSFYDMRPCSEPPTWLMLHIQDVGIILELTEREQHIIKLKVEGHTNEEIGEVFGITEVAIRKILKKLQGRYLVATRKYPGMLRPQ